MKRNIAEEAAGWPDPAGDCLTRRLRAKIMGRKLTRRVFKACVGFLLLSLFLFVYTTLDLGHALEADWLDERIRNQGRLGWLLFVLLAALVTAVAGPRQLVSFAGGYLYGVALGVSLAVAGALLGCAADFFMARFFLRNWVKRRMGRRLQRINCFLERSPFLMTIIIRLLPLGNNTATSLAAGLSSITPAPFLAGSALGYLPQTLIFTLLGNGMQLNQGWSIASSALLFGVSVGLGVYLYRKLHLAA